jgi:hypothetical protein
VPAANFREGGCIGCCWTLFLPGPVQPPFTARPGTCPENCREKFLPLIPWTIPCKHFTSRASVPHFHSQSSWNTRYVLSWNSGCFKIVVSLSVRLEYQLWHRLEFQLYQYRNFHQELLDLCAQTFFSVDLLWIECMSAVLTGARSAIGTARSLQSSKRR